MTLEEIKQYIKDQLDSIEKSAAWICGDEFEGGKDAAYSNCLSMLEDLEPSWHPYPKYKPPVGRDVLIQWDDGCMSIGWSSSEILGFAESFRKVIAWAELPKPYKEDT